MPAPLPSSTLNLSSLQEFETPSLLDIRPMLSFISRDVGSEDLTNVLEQIQNSIDNIQNTLRSSSPSLDYLEIDAADIGSLFVGSEYGPGQFAVFNGPPDYAPIGWIGSADSQNPVNITNIVGGLITTAADHGLLVNDVVLIESTSNPAHNGYFTVATTPGTTTFTCTGLTGNSTGGTATQQFQGGWLRTLAVGGTGFDDAKFIADVDGSLSIYDASIRIEQASNVIEMAPDGTGILVSGNNGTTYSQMQEGLIQIVSTPGTLALLSSLSGFSIDLPVTPDDSQVQLEANGYHGLELLCYGANDNQILFDSSWDKPNHIASSTSAGRIGKIGSKLYFSGAASLTPDAPFAFIDLMTLDLTNGYLGILDSSPSYPLDVGGVINAVDGYAVDGTPGINLVQALVTAVVPNSFLLQYKDHAGINQTLTVVTGVAVSSTLKTWKKGLLTA